MTTATQLNLSPSCATPMGQAGMLAGMFRSKMPGQFHLPDLPMGKLPSDLGKAFELNGVASLLRSLPFSGSAMSGFGESALIAGLLASIQSTLRVNLLKPNAASQLLTALQTRLAAKPFSVPFPAAFESPGLLRQFSQLGSFAHSLKSNLNIDIFGPTGARDLSRFLSSPALLQSAGGGGSQNPLWSGLSKLSVALSAPRSFASLGLPTMALGAPKMPSLQALRAPGLNHLWPQISSGTLGNQLRLPSIGQVASFNSRMAALKAFEKLTGMRASDPRFNLQLGHMMDSFKTNNICAVLCNSPLSALSSTGRPAALQVSSAIENIRSASGVNLLEPGAGAALKPIVGNLTRQAAVHTAAAPGAWADLIAPLKRIADLGTALA